jgi:PPOX class probable F420-dependent enzyme
VTPDEARAQLATAVHAYLATADADGRPHIVPICFALDGDTIYSAVDHKPKHTTRLKRLANIEANPRVSVLADHYEDDWTQLWWVRADGLAQVLDTDRHAVELLRVRYEPYRTQPPQGPVIAIAVTRWSGWPAGDRDGVACRT